jgi:hypothetical protein
VRKLAVAYGLWPLTLNLTNVHPAGEPRSTQSGWDLSSSVNSPASAVEDDRNRQLAVRYELERECARSAGAVLVRPYGFIAFRCAEAVSDPTAALNAAFDQILPTNER